MAARLARRPADRDRKRIAARAHLQGPRRELTAHQLSTAAGAIGLFAGYFELLARRWPLPSTRQALEVGTAWLALTVAFEFGFGHYVAHTSWRELLADYNLRKGRLWPLVLAWITLGPALVRARSVRASGVDRLSGRRHGRRPRQAL